jgi:hypothetical protein
MASGTDAFHTARSDAGAVRARPRAPQCARGPNRLPAIPIARLAEHVSLVFAAQVVRVFQIGVELRRFAHARRHADTQLVPRLAQTIVERRAADVRLAR